MTPQRLVQSRALRTLAAKIRYDTSRRYGEIDAELVREAADVFSELAAAQPPQPQSDMVMVPRELNKPMLGVFYWQGAFTVQQAKDFWGQLLTAAQKDNDND